MHKLAWVLAALALPAAATAATRYKVHEMDGVFVSADPEASTFTMTIEDGAQTTERAEGAAARAIKHLKPGDRIEVTCRDNARGEHLAATAIRILK